MTTLANDEAIVWLSLDGLIETGQPVRRHAYTRITDAQIAAATPLSSTKLQHPWEASVNAAFASGLTEAEIDITIHAPRIAGFAQLILSGIALAPIDIEFGESIYINDGNHRLRAYLYAGYKTFPVLPGGYMDLAALAERETRRLQNA